MAKKIVVTKRFRNNTLGVYQYLVQEFSQKIANRFIDQIEQRIDLITNHPEIGKLSSKKKNIRSIILKPHNQIFYKYDNDSIEILCLFDMRKHPGKKPY